MQLSQQTCGKTPRCQLVVLGGRVLSKLYSFFLPILYDPIFFIELKTRLRVSLFCQFFFTTIQREAFPLFYFIQPYFIKLKNPTTSVSFLLIFFYNDPTRSVSPILFYTALFYQTKNPTTTGFSFLSIFLYTKPNSFIFFSPSKS